MSLTDRLTDRLLDDPDPCRAHLPQAAVLALIDEHPAAGPLVVLTRRAEHLRLHAGEVAFPGGMCDPEDHSHWQTALREAREEIELPADRVQYLGTLPSLVTRTGIEVTPCVGRLKQPTRYTANPEELAEVFEVPLGFFADRSQLDFARFDYGGRERWVPSYQWQATTIWGITAAILVKLVNLGLDAGLEMDDYWLGKADTD